MTHDDLAALIQKLEPDRLLTKPAMGFWLAGNGVKDAAACLAYCEAKGLLCTVERNGVAKWYRDGEAVEVKPVVAVVPEPAAPAPPKSERPKRQPPPITAQPQLFGR